MSVTFSVVGTEVDYETGTGYVNMANGNARSVLLALGVNDDDLCGSMRGRELTKRCEKALSMKLPGDEGFDPSVEKGETGPTIVYCGRPAGYVSARIREILELAKSAGDIGVVSWG